MYVVKMFITVSSMNCINIFGSFTVLMVQPAATAAVPVELLLIVLLKY